MIRSESEETKDYVRERLPHEDFIQEEVDEIGFVPSALNELQGAMHWCDNRGSEHGNRFNQVGAMVTEECGEAYTSICVTCASRKSQFGMENSR